MPPREKVSKVTVTDKAFAMTREYGFKEVTARKLAQELGCSTQPIFRAYDNMDELRSELFYMSTEFFNEKILAKKSRTKPLYLTVALTYIELAKSERNLFELIASIDDFGSQTIEEFLEKDEWQEIVMNLPDTDGMSSGDKKELFMMLWMFVHGLASLIVSGRVVLSDKKVKELLTKAYDGFRSQI